MKTEQISPFYFFSYNWEDKEIVHKFVRDFVKEYSISDNNYFFDEEHVDAGNNLTQQIQDAIIRADKVVVFLGPNEIGKTQNLEILYAASRERNYNQDIRIIPILLPPLEKPLEKEYPLVLADKVWLTFKDSIRDEVFRGIYFSGVKATRNEISSPIKNTRNPYKGLRSFDVEDHDVFFGRAEEINYVLESKLHIQEASNSQPKFLAILANSGVGKSSFVKAGLIGSMITKSAQYGLRNNWKHLIVTPGQEPLMSLSIALKKAGLIDDSESWERKAEQDERYNTLKRTIGEQSDRWIIFFDQFEEIVTLCQAKTDNKETNDYYEAQRGIVLNNIVQAVVCPNVVILLSMRQEYYCSFSEYNDFKTLLEDNNYQLPSLDYKKAIRQTQGEDYKKRFIQTYRDIIVSPASRYGRAPEEDFTEQVIRSIMRIDGALPMVQLALEQIWNESSSRNVPITRKLLMSMSLDKGIKGIIHIHADKVFGELTKNDSTWSSDRLKEIFRKIFIPLMHVSEGGEALRRTALKSEILNMFVNENEKSKASEIIEKLSNEPNRLIVINSNYINNQSSQEEVHVEVIHEVLFREWDLLSSWVVERRKDIGKFKLYIHAIESNANLKPTDAYLRELKSFMKANPDLVIPKITSLMQQSEKQLEKNKYVPFSILFIIIILLMSFTVVEIYRSFSDVKKPPLYTRNLWQGKDFKIIELQNIDFPLSKDNLELIGNSPQVGSTVILNNFQSINNLKIPEKFKLTDLVIGNTTIDISVHLICPTRDTLDQKNIFRMPKHLDIFQSRFKDSDFKFDEHWSGLERLMLNNNHGLQKLDLKALRNLSFLTIINNSHLRQKLELGDLELLKTLIIKNNSVLEGVNFSAKNIYLNEVILKNNYLLSEIYGLDSLSPTSKIVIETSNSISFEYCGENYNFETDTILRTLRIEFNETGPSVEYLEAYYINGLDFSAMREKYSTDIYKLDIEKLIVYINSKDDFDSMSTNKEFINKIQCEELHIVFNTNVDSPLDFNLIPQAISITIENMFWKSSNPLKLILKSDKSRHVKNLKIKGGVFLVDYNDMNSFDKLEIIDLKDFQGTILNFNRESTNSTVQHIFNEDQLFHIKEKTYLLQ